jgi:diketogulonate reductase-like aldo/keto reductase
VALPAHQHTLAICAGTMLFGESQDYPTACQLLDECMAAGINFFDTAEMYPVPQSAETQGLSESYLGEWMKKHSRCGAHSISRCWHTQLIAPQHDRKSLCPVLQPACMKSCRLRCGGN